MSKRIALLFSGQGAQSVGMGKDLAAQYEAARKIFSEADRILGYGISEIAFEGPEPELVKTVNCQPALYLHGLASLAALRQEIGELNIVAAAGLSLGEFTAHAAAGTFGFEDGLKLVARRGKLMQDACESAGGAMAALIGGDESSVRELAREHDVDVANFNSPGQIVISGAKEKIEAAVAGAKDKGIRRATLLNVAGAYHSRLMQPAADALGEALAATPMSAPQFPVIANVSAAPVQDPDDIRAKLKAQVTGSVRWTEIIEYLADTVKPDLFLELGPGEVIAGLVRRTRKEVALLSISNCTTLEAALREMKSLPVGV